MVNDTYSALRRAITEFESALGALKASLNISTDPAAAEAEDTPAPAVDSTAESFSTPALVAHAPDAVPTITPVDEADVPAEVKGQDQSA